MDILNSFNPLSDGDRKPDSGDIGIIQGMVVFIGVLVIVIIMGLLCGCAAPKAVEEHHHHYSEADTAAVGRMVEARLASWHAEIEALMRQRLEQFASSLQQQEHEHETITETVTVTLDSLGREMRQEQRTVSRDVSREMQAVEQRIVSEYESRLRAAIDSASGCWQSRYDSLQARVARLDSASLARTPVADARPWYRRASDALLLIIIGAVLALIVKRFFV